MPNKEIHEDEINLLDYWRVVYKRKGLIGIIIGVAFVASIIYSLSLPNIYSSTTSILPPQQEGSMTTGLAATQLPGGLAGLAGGFLGVKSPADLWVAILKSQTLKGAIIDRFDLIKVFEAQSAEEARDTLGGMVNISKSKEGIIAITIEYKDPRMAATLAGAFVEELDRINKGIVMTSGRRMRIFVEERLKDAKVELAKAEDTIKIFQEKNKAVQLEDQSTAIIGVMGSVKGEIMAKEVELQTLLSYATPNNPRAEILKTQVEELRGQLTELEMGKKSSGNPLLKDLFIPTAKIPDLALQYVRLLREAKVQQALYELLTQQYEMARIKEAKDTPTVQVLDEAMVPNRRIKPKRRKVVLIYTVVAAFFAILVAFFIEFIQGVKSQYKPYDS